MPARTCVIWGPEFTRYDFGDGHPMAPIRIDLTARLCESFGVFDGIEVIDDGCGMSPDEMARRLGRHRSTIHREIGRNFWRDPEVPMATG